MPRYLVVANQTLVSTELMERVWQRLEGDVSNFHLVVPATRLRQSWTWTNGRAHAFASERLRAALDHFAAIGVEATGEVGDANPMAAISDCMLAARFDGIILSTLPPGRSEWLKQDLPSRVGRAFGVPVTHVVAGRVPVG